MDMNYASKGGTNAGLTTGIIGSALGLLNGVLGIGREGGRHQDHFVNRNEMSLIQELSKKDSEIALRDANIYNDKKSLELYPYIDGRLRGIEEQIAQQAVFNQMLSVFKKNDFQPAPDTKEGKFFAEWTEVQDELAHLFAEGAAAAADRVATAAKTVDGLAIANTPAEAGVKNMMQNDANAVIDLSKDNRLSQMVGDLHGSARYNIIRDYILDELKDQPIRMSDGKLAIVDRHDAQHIAHGSDAKNAAEVAQIKKIVDFAELVAEAPSTKERKFNWFWYYKAFVKYHGETIPVYINVGQARNDSSYHIYDITQKLRDTAHRVYDVGRPVGNALVSSISTNSISNPSEKATPPKKKILCV